MAHRFISDINAARVQQFFDHAQAQQKTKVQPPRVADCLGRETVVSVRSEMVAVGVIHVRILAAAAMPVLS